jgi:serine/threonine protein kinase
MTLSTGTKFGRYEIRSPLGAGGMGEVYLAQDTKLDRKVALKILPADVAANRGWDCMTILSALLERSRWLSDVLGSLF